jgi:thiol-disulfide isomerase/thioredoxin
MLSAATLCSIPTSAQAVSVKKIDHLEKVLNSSPAEILVINFWATWCAPCVKELPLFDSLATRKDARIKIVLVNLDFADKVDKVEAFVTRKKILSEVFLLDEVDYNSWIDKVDPSWQGAIPATLIKNTQTGQRKFIAKELAEGDLEKVIQELLNRKL